jgi:DNA-binding transcriptional regulator YhcF (GntR family)
LVGASSSSSRIVVRPELVRISRREQHETPLTVRITREAVRWERTEDEDENEQDALPNWLDKNGSVENRHNHFTPRMKDVSPDFFPPIPVADDPSKPMYVQLYDWFRSAIISGGLRPGQKVFSSRQLASELKVSRITVLTAFQQLHAEGYLEGSVGSGTYVAKSIPDHAVKLTLGDALRRLPLDSDHGPRRVSKLGTKFLSAPVIPRGFRAFQVGLPALDRFPRAIWSRLLIRHSRQTKKELMAYGNPMDRSACREAAGARLIPVRIDQEGLDVNRGIKRRPDARALPSSLPRTNSRWG